MNEKRGFSTTKEARKQLQVSEASLRRWADQGLIPSIRTPGGQRLYDVEQFISDRGNQATNSEITQELPCQKICYCRVSSHGQKDDLQRQIEYMSQQFPDHTIISDIGSGINFKRKGLRSILQLASKGMVEQVVVAYRDRLCRFAFELVEWFLQIHGVELVVLHQNMESSGQSELAEDLLAIINVFNCRINGKRKYTRHKEPIPEEQEESKADSQ